MVLFLCVVKLAFSSLASFYANVEKDDYVAEPPLPEDLPKYSKDRFAANNPNLKPLATYAQAIIDATVKTAKKYGLNKAQANVFRSSYTP